TMRSRRCRGRSTTPPRGPAVAMTCRRAIRPILARRPPILPARPPNPAPEVFPAFADVPAYPLVFPVFWGAAAFFALAMARHLRVFAAARNASPTDHVGARLWGTLRYGIVQTRMFRDMRAGLLHAGIFWGFVLLTVGTANIVTGGLIEAVLSIPFDGALWTAVSAMQNVVAVIVLL